MSVRIETALHSQPRLVNLSKPPPLPAKVSRKSDTRQLSKTEATLPARVGSEIRFSFRTRIGEDEGRHPWRLRLFDDRHGSLSGRRTGLIRDFFFRRQEDRRAPLMEKQANSRALSNGIT